MKRTRTPNRKRKAAFPRPRPKPKVKKKVGGSRLPSAPPDVPRTKPPKPSEKRRSKSSTTRGGGQGRSASGVPPKKRVDSYKSRGTPPKPPRKPAKPRKGGGRGKPPPPPKKPVKGSPKRPKRPGKPRDWRDYVDAARDAGAGPRDVVPEELLEKEGLPGDTEFYEYIAFMTNQDPSDIYSALAGSPKDGM